MVLGFFRAHKISIQQYDSSFIIPSLVIYTCLTYYWINEYLDVINESVVSRSDDKMIITNKTRDTWNNISVGKTTINSISNGVYKWKLKFSGSDLDAMMGVTNGNDVSQSVASDSLSTCYGYFSKGFLYPSCVYVGKRIEEGDIVNVVLDLTNKQLLMSINDSDESTFTIDVKCEENLVYRFAVTLHDHLFQSSFNS